MARPVSSGNEFVVDLLTTLRNDRFTPRAWARFIARSWDMSRRTARETPSLKRSWWRVTMCIAALSAFMLLASALLEGPGIALRLLPGFALCVAWQQSDLYWHLGLLRQAQTGTLLPVVGSANILTLLRGLAASLLLGRLVGGVSTPTTLVLALFLCGIVTDILDGQVARLSRTQSKFGQIGDGEADFSLSVATAFILVQNGILPLWIGLIMMARFLLPLLAAFVSYFALAQPVRFSSTWWGKCAGVAQCLYFLVLLAPPQLACITRWLNLPLLIATLFLLIAAPIAQIAANMTIS